MRKKQDDGYTDRLFSSGTLRGFFHNSRFLWFRRTLEKLPLSDYRAVEIGCFDGRLLGFFPRPPVLYEGLDADWEGGLSAAQAAYAGHASWRFRLVTTPSALADFRDRTFNVGAALETLEHVPPDLVDGYLKELARVVDGYLLVSIPNEKGIVFLVKWLVKRFVFGSTQDYRVSEIVAATLGRMDKVARHDHKGFDYAVLLRQIEQYFDLVKVEGVPFSFLPPALSFTVCVLARSR